ncbi:MAG: hypothetical protein AAGG51_21320 [Cyanobacteria bacterium P01_G01_bin.54]
MNQQLTLELNQQTFASIRLKAQTLGVSPEQFAATWLEQQFAQTQKPQLSEIEKDAARTRFERHFGTLGQTTLERLDNETID